MRVEVERPAAGGPGRAQQGGKVVLGGHSLGGSITTAYATWDFNGTPGAKGLVGLVYDRRRQQPDPGHRAMQARAVARRPADGLAVARVRRHRRPVRRASSPSAGSTLGPDRPERAVDRPGVAAPAGQPEAAGPGHQPRRSTGYALDTETSPAEPRRRQAHVGHLAASGDPRGWDQAGDITPIAALREDVLRHRGRGHRRHRLVPPDAANDRLGRGRRGQPEPAQQVPRSIRRPRRPDQRPDLRVRRLPRGTRVLDAARALARQSGLPASKPT